MSSHQQWYYINQTREEAGPVSSEQLLEMVYDNIIEKSTYVWTQELEGWAPANTIKGLFPEQRKEVVKPILIEEFNKEIGAYLLNIQNTSSSSQNTSSFHQASQSLSISKISLDFPREPESKTSVKKQAEAQPIVAAPTVTRPAPVQEISHMNNGVTAQSYMTDPSQLSIGQAKPVANQPVSNTNIPLATPLGIGQNPQVAAQQQQAIQQATQSPQQQQITVQHNGPVSGRLISPATAHLQGQPHSQLQNPAMTPNNFPAVAHVQGQIPGQLQQNIQVNRPLSGALQSPATAQLNRPATQLNRPLTGALQSPAPAQPNRPAAQLNQPTPALSPPAPAQLNRPAAQLNQPTPALSPPAPAQPNRPAAQLNHPAPALSPPAPAIPAAVSPPKESTNTPKQKLSDPASLRAVIKSTPLSISSHGPASKIKSNLNSLTGTQSTPPAIPPISDAVHRADQKNIKALTQAVKLAAPPRSMKQILENDL